MCQKCVVVLLVSPISKVVSSILQLVNIDKNSTTRGSAVCNYGVDTHSVR